MERIVMTWGIILRDNDTETIYCGDADSSGTKELNFEIIEDSCNGIDNDFNVKLDNSELWDSESTFYEAIASYLSTYLGIFISPSKIYGGYVLVNDEPDDYSSRFEIIDSKAGVFTNSNQEHNGKIFLRYYFEDDDEIYEEIVCVGFVE
jgi:hypothetical protein